MPLVKRKIPVEQVEFSASALKSRQLPLAVMSGVYLTVEVNYNTGAGTLTAEDFWRHIIRKIEIVLNGQDVLINIPFEFLIHMNTMEFSVAPPNGVDVSASSSVAAYGYFYLPFELLNSVIPRDTMLDARSLSTCVMNVHWGSAADIGNITAITSGSVKLTTKEFSNIPEGLKTARHEYSYDEILLDVIGTIRYQLPTRGSNQYRRLWIMTLDGSTPQVLSNSEISNIKIAARSFVYYDRIATHNWAEQYKLFNRTALTGIYCVDFTSEGQMTTRLDARELPELTLELTSSVTDGKAIIITEKAVYASKPGV